MGCGGSTPGWGPDGAPPKGSSIVVSKEFSAGLADQAATKTVGTRGRITSIMAGKGGGKTGVMVAFSDNENAPVFVACSSFTDGTVAIQDEGTEDITYPEIKNYATQVDDLQKPPQARVEIDGKVGIIIKINHKKDAFKIRWNGTREKDKPDVKKKFEGKPTSEEVIRNMTQLLKDGNKIITHDSHRGQVKEKQSMKLGAKKMS